MREVKFEVMFWLHSRNFTKSVAKHYTTLDRLTNGEDSFDYSSVEVVAKRQYTGKKDKNGVEIYDKDLIKINWADWSISIGVMEAPSLIEGAWIENDERSIPLWDCDSNGQITSIEVIGNIYENPGLLND